jgi:hypothetical protein
VIQLIPDRGGEEFGQRYLSSADFDGIALRRGLSDVSSPRYGLSGAMAVRYGLSGAMAVRYGVSRTVHQ